MFQVKFWVHLNIVEKSMNHYILIKIMFVVEDINVTKKLMWMLEHKCVILIVGESHSMTTLYWPKIYPLNPISWNTMYFDIP